jgi:hypothetical protein
MRRLRTQARDATCPWPALASIEARRGTAPEPRDLFNGLSFPFLHEIHYGSRDEEPLWTAWVPAKLIFRVHALRRMFARSITASEVRTVLEQGDTIESYPQDTPYPSRLVLGYAGGRALHVVVADNEDDGETIVVTAYEPDPALWQPGFRRRRK